MGNHQREGAHLAGDAGSALDEDAAGIPAWFRADNESSASAPGEDWRALTLRLGGRYPLEAPVVEFAERAAGSGSPAAEAARAAFHATVGVMERPLTVTKLGRAWQAVLANSATQLAA